MANAVDVAAARDAILNHKAWLAVDALGDPKQVRPPEAYRHIGKLLAALADDECMAIYDPRSRAITLYDPALREVLGGPEPLSVFGEHWANFVRVEREDPRMTAAVEEARRRWPEFVAAFGKRRPDQTFAVKIAFREGEIVEFMWVKVAAIEGEQIRGILDNEPVDVKSVRHGDSVQVKLADLNDWIYVQDGTMIGGFTVKVLQQLEKERPS
jgi:uncharacterized protein YegJ (DUF2314 family)